MAKTEKNRDLKAAAAAMERLLTAVAAIGRMHLDTSEGTPLHRVGKAHNDVLVALGRRRLGNRWQARF